MLEHVMCDLETLGTGPESVILSIGAIAFDPDSGTLGPKFYQALDLDTSARYGRLDTDTILWWMKQSDEARQVFSDPDRKPLPDTLSAFTKWLGQATTCPEGEVKLWGNGSDFDNVILSRAYYNCDIPAPWKFYNNRCYRTLKSLVPATKLLRTGTHHNALDDAISQAQHLLVLWEALGLRKEVQP